jgi:hypothetical protein
MGARRNFRPRRKQASHTRGVESLAKASDSSSLCMLYQSARDGLKEFPTSSWSLNWEDRTITERRVRPSGSMNKSSE